MHNVTQNFLNTIKLPNRGFKSTVKIRDTIFDDTNIIDMSLEENVNPADSFMLGSVASNKLEVTLIDVPNILILENAIVNPNLSLLVGSNYEDVPLGVFTVDEISKDKSTVKLTCFDNMIKLERAYFSNLSYPASVNSVAQEICSKAGVQLATSLPSTLINKIEGYTYREAISFIASFLGGFARFNRIGKLEIVSYSTTNIEVTGDNYFKLTTNEKPLTIGRLACQVGENIISVGASGNEIKFENPIMTQVQLNNIFNTLKALSYMPYSMDWQGNPALMVGDKIKITDVKGNTYNTLLMQQKLSYKGGLSATATAKGKTEQAQEFSSNGSMKNKVERVVAEQANIKLALIEKATIEDLTVVNARIDNLYTTDLIAVNAKITNLEVHKADVIKLNAETARINDLYATKATIVDLTAARGKITLLETKVGSIDTILSKEIFVELMTAEKIVAGSSIIAEGAIGSAQINSLDLNKLNAGSIDTSKIQLVGPNGRLKLVGNKLQIFDTIDGQQYERVMLGVDDSNNSTIVLRGADGKTVLLNQDGLTKPGFTDGYNKLEDNSLPGAKLDINSVMRGMNEKGTETIKGTKVSIGDRTLDVELSTQKNLIDGANKELSTQKATVSAMDQAIKLKVDNQTFTQYKSTTEGNLSNINTNLNKATSSIDVLQKDIKLKVSQDDINTLESKVLDPKLLTKLNGTELFNQTYSSDTTSKPFVYGSYTVVPCTELGLIDNKNLIKTINAAHLKTDFIPYTTDNLYYMSLEAYNKDTTTGILYVGIEFYDKDKVSLGINDLAIYGVVAKVEDLPVNTWKTLEGYVKTDASRNKAAFIRLRVLTRYGVTGITYMKGFTLKQLGAYPLSIVDTKIDTKVSEINITLDGVTTRVGKTESASTVIDGKVTALATKVATVEQKITPGSITSTVRNSTAYKGDLNSKASTTDLQTAQSSISQLSNSIASNVTETSTIKGVVTSHTSSINQLSNDINSRVKTGEFESYKSQTATAISQKVSTGEFSSKFSQNAQNFEFSIGQTGKNTIYIDKNGLIIRHGTGSSWTHASADGLYHYDAAGNRGYHYLSYQSFLIIPAGVKYLRINLPADFKGKDFKIMPNISTITNISDDWAIKNWDSGYDNVDKASASFTLIGFLQVQHRLTGETRYIETGVTYIATA